MPSSLSIRSPTSAPINYLNYLARFVKPGGTIGMATVGLMQELETDVPRHLQPWWEHGMWSFHSAPWWRDHWGKTGILDIEVADTLPDGWLQWLEWQRFVAPGNLVEIQALETDGGSHLGYVRVLGRRRADANLDEPIVSIPAAYAAHPLLR